MEASLMAKRGPKRMRRTEYYVAARQIATNAIRAAMPHLRAAEIADALGFNRHAVKRYLLGNVKAGQSAAPPWAGELVSACRLLCSSQPGRAADVFDRLARQLASAEKSGGPGA